MAGLNLGMGGVRVNADAALTKRTPKKYSEGGSISDPIPAGRPAPVAPKGPIVGSHCPRPVPAVAASDFEAIVAFHPNTGFCVDPIPARSV